MLGHQLTVSIKRTYEPSRSPAGIGVLAAAGPVTLAFAACDADHSNAALFRNLLLRSGG